MQRRNGLYKVSKEGQCCTSPAQETAGDVFESDVCQQFHGTGSLEKMRMKKENCVTGNFVSARLDGSLVGDSFAG